MTFYSNLKLTGKLLLWLWFQWEGFANVSASTGSGNWNLAMSPFGTDSFAGASLNLNFANIDETSGKIDLLAGSTFFISRGRFATFSGIINFAETTASAAPEPATWGMMILGFGAAGFSLRQQRRKVADRLTLAS